MQKIKFLLMALILTTGAGQRIHAQATFPVNDVANPKDGGYAFTNASIVKDAATIFCIADKTGTVKTGKDDNIIVCEGDIPDMRTIIINHAFLQGSHVDLDNKQKQPAEKYRQKYGIK